MIFFMLKQIKEWEGRHRCQCCGNKDFTDSINCDINTTARDYDKFQVHFATKIHLQIVSPPSQTENEIAGIHFCGGTVLLNQ